MTDRPQWWSWELEFSPHILKRMIDRGFSETDLRAMMEAALGFREDVEPGRWLIEARHDSRMWQVVVEPDASDELLVVITAFPVDRS